MAAPNAQTGVNGADSYGGVSTAVGAGASASAVNAAGASTAPGTYGEHPIPPSYVQAAPVPAPDPNAFDFTGLGKQLGAIAGLLLHIDADLHSMRPKPDVYRAFYLSGQPYRLDRFDRRYSRILVGANIAVILDSPIGNITVNLVAGWNILDYPDGAYISTAGTAANVLYLCSDSQNG